MSLDVPIIDVGALFDGDAAARQTVADALGEAMERVGFFYIVGHRVDARLIADLESTAREFFARPAADKLAIAMQRGGRAWRGYFPVGGELTSGRPDNKEGIYFGAELAADHPAVRAQLPLHGANLFPAAPATLRALVLDYIATLTALGHVILRGISRSLALDENYFDAHYTRDPLTLFRIFNYPASAPDGNAWGVGEHTDYGLLTILKQDDVGGLEVKTADGWRAAPPIAGSFVCNIGDMLERLTRGRYVSTLHRVANRSQRDRLSLPFFFDPAFATKMTPLPLPLRAQATRWDGVQLDQLRGTYGDYLISKVSRVFPALSQAALTS